MRSSNNQNCNNACAAKTLQCDETLYYNQMVSDIAGSVTNMENIIQSVTNNPSFSCNTGNSNGASNAAVPRWKGSNNRCIYPNAGMDSSVMDCSTAGGTGWKKLCYCTSDQMPSPPSPPMAPPSAPAPSQWLMAGSAESCDTGCAAVSGLECDETDFIAQLGDVDTQAEVEAVIQGTGYSPAGTPFACDIFVVENNAQVPSVRTGSNKCRVPGSGFTTSNLGCATAGQVGWLRLCWCSQVSSGRRLEEYDKDNDHTLALGWDGGGGAVGNAVENAVAEVRDWTSILFRRVRQSIRNRNGLER